MADTVWVRGAGGVAVEMSLPLHETIEDQVRSGQASVIEGPDGASTPLGAPQLRNNRPALNDRKAEWVSWAVHEGADPDEAEGLTKDDLIERYGHIEPGTGEHVKTDGE